MNSPAIANIEEPDFNVMLKQHLSHTEFRDSEAKNTLRVYATSVQTVGVPGIQRGRYLEIEGDARFDGDRPRIVKSLSANDIKRIDEAGALVVDAIEAYRPGFERPFAEFSCNVVNGINVGAVKREAGDWTCFVELSDGLRALRCGVGDFGQMYQFRVAVVQAGNF